MKSVLVKSSARKGTLMKTGRVLEDFPIVCLGGATPDVNGFAILMQNLPADLGVAVVVINHVRSVADLLFDTLTQNAKMPVILVTDKLPIMPNCVFVLPQGWDLHVLDGLFRLKPVSKPRGWTDVITLFLCSLTDHWVGQLVAVILSGLDGDGAKALRDIKEVGGITIAQKIESTGGDPNMPSSAIATGKIDFVLSLEDIAKQIARIAHAKDARRLEL